MAGNPSEAGKNIGVTGRSGSGESGIIRFRARVPVTGKSGFVTGAEMVTLQTGRLKNPVIPDQGRIRLNNRFDPQSPDYEPR
ncbi:MAG: hypothetical protein M1268_02600 [Patescibacteria group bacterium]|nr:hypothetical protein [Actinomycetota bacterium]MCL5438855.1 hypothetical protein [Patescibacteria group bacterium]